MVDFSLRLRELRDSVQQTVFDINTAYEQCYNINTGATIEECDRLIDALLNDARYLRRNLDKFIDEEYANREVDKYDASS